VRSRCGLSTLVDPSNAPSRSSLTSHAPSLNRLPVTPSVNTPRHPGRYGLAQPLHVICADAGTGVSQTTPSAITHIIRLNITRLRSSWPTARTSDRAAGITQHGLVRKPDSPPAT